VYPYDARNQKFDEHWPKHFGIVIQIEASAWAKHFMHNDVWYEAKWRFAVYSGVGNRHNDVQPKYNWLNENAVDRSQWSLGGTRKGWDFIDFSDETLAAAFRMVWC
jgi:hypothetical protein